MTDNNFDNGEQRFIDLLGSLPCVAWETGADMALVGLWGRVREVFGYEPHELIGRPLLFTADAADRERAAAALAAAAAARQPLTSVAWWCRARDGRRVRVAANGHALTDSAGNLAGYRGTFLDVTDSYLHSRCCDVQSRLQALAGSEDAAVSALLCEACAEQTDSPISFFGMVEPDGSAMVAHVWSPLAMDQCRIVEKPLRFPVATAGLWAEPIRQGKPVICNDYPKAPGKRGLPLGHVPLSRYLGVPMISRGRIIAVAGVANKPTAYDDTDVQRLRLLAAGTADLLFIRGAEAALRESLQTAADIVRAIPSGLFIYQFEPPDRLILQSANPEAERLTGVRAAQWAGREFAEIWPEARSAGVTERFIQVMRTGETFETEDLQYADERLAGAYRIHAFRLPGERLAVAFENITERKRAEQALRESEHRFRTIADFTGDWEYWLSPEGTVLYVSPSCEDITGHSAAELSAEPSLRFSLVHPGDRERFIAHETAFHTGKRRDHETGEVEFRIVARNGSVRWIGHRCRPVYDATGAFAGRRVSNRDITERKRSEERLRQREAELEALVSSLDDLVFELMPDGTVVNIWARDDIALFVPRERALGRRLRDILGADFAVQFERAVREVAAGEAAIDIECRSPLPGDNRHWNARFSRVQRPGKQEARVVCVIRDITERVRMEESLRNAQKLESLGVLAGGIAHDFNNLLGGLFGYMDMATEAVRTGKIDRGLAWLTKALAVFDRARALTSQLLTFSKGGAPVRRPTNLSGTLNNSLSLSLSGSQIRCEAHIADDLWVCNVDEHQIGQVIDNIVINARQAMPAGGVLRVRAENAGPVGLPPGLKPASYVRITIADEGTGIAPEHIPRIFDPFFTTKQQGSGLGLATAYSIVKKHGGMIEVFSQLGEGATFVIHLPAMPGAAGAEDGGPGERYQGHGRVLVMDDELSIQDLAAMLLGQLGFDADTVADGAAAVARFRKAMEEGKPYALVILDLTVPGGMGGVAALAAIRAVDPGVKAIASSGYSNDPVLANAAARGFAGALAKPYRKQELVSVLRTVLGG